jgi:uncharacterized DUF497 family protein
MEIDFDPAKSERNRTERGFGFGFAARIFLGRISVSFARAQQGEVRMKAVGRIEDYCYAVIFFDDGDVRRIVSARRANRKETQQWLASE